MRKAHDAHPFVVKTAREKVVLLHSALGDSRLWRRQRAVLDDRFDVVAPDLPGWGETPVPIEPFSFVDVVAAELPAALVGNSFGGAVALRTALAHPGRVTKLALVGSGLPAWDWTEEMRNYFAAEEAAIEAGDLDAAAEVNLAFWVAPEHHDEVRPQQRRSLELQTAHEDPELLWPELPTALEPRRTDARRRRRSRQGRLPGDREAPGGEHPAARSL